MHASRRELDEKENHETLEPFKSPHLDREEIRGSNLIEVSREEFSPSGLSFPLGSWIDSIAFEDVRDSVGGEIVPEVGQSTPDTPLSVLSNKV